MSSPIEEWVVLPDEPGAEQMAAVKLWRSHRLLEHGSGRPCVVGNIDLNELIIASLGENRVALIGRCPVSATHLQDRVSELRGVEDIDWLIRPLPGSFHVVASIDGVVRAQGTVAGLRRVFYTRTSSFPLASGRADTLAKMNHSAIDEQILATRVVCGPLVPPPVNEQPLWKGVEALPTDHYLYIARDGKISAVRWWRPPRPQVDLQTGAGLVRDALESAVEVRKPTLGRLSADLSGGMDSTSLCFIAAQAGVSDLLTFRWAESDVANDDAAFASQAIESLPSSEHLVVPQNDMPGVFADPMCAEDAESPYQLTRTLRRIRDNERFPLGVVEFQRW